MTDGEGDVTGETETEQQWASPIPTILINDAQFHNFIRINHREWKRRVGEANEPRVLVEREEKRREEEEEEAISCM